MFDSDAYWALVRTHKITEFTLSRQLEIHGKIYEAGTIVNMTDWNNSQDGLNHIFVNMQARTIRVRFSDLIPVTSKAVVNFWRALNEKIMLVLDETDDHPRNGYIYQDSLSEAIDELHGVAKDNLGESPANVCIVMCKGKPERFYLAFKANMG